MKAIFILLLLTVSPAAFAVDPGVAELRALYYKAPSDKASSDQLLKKVAGIGPDADPLMRCYKGTALVLKANYSFNPYCKYAYFSEGRALLEHAIKDAPDNVEIRFMRFCIQTNAPFFLGYNKEIKTDKAMILRSWSSVTDNDLKERIKNYLLASGYCNKNDKAILL